MRKLAAMTFTAVGAAAAGAAVARRRPALLRRPVAGRAGQGTADANAAAATAAPRATIIEWPALRPAPVPEPEAAPAEAPLEERAEPPLPWEERAGTVARRVVATALLAVAVGGVAAIRASGAKHLAPAPTPAARAAGGPLVMALTEPTPGGAARGALSAHLDSVGAIAPDWARLGSGGSFTYTSFAPSLAGLVARGERVVPVVRDPDGRAPGILADPLVRDRLAIRLADALSVLGAAGVVLDIPDVPAAARRDYPDFVRELARRTGKPVYVTVPAFANEQESHQDWGYDLRDLARPATLLVRSFTEHDEPPRPARWRASTGSAPSCATRRRTRRAAACCSASRTSA